MKVSTARFRQAGGQENLIIESPAVGIAGRRPDVNSPPPSTINSAAECPLERS